MSQCPKIILYICTKQINFLRNSRPFHFLTLVANLLLCGWIVSTTGQLTRNIKDPSNILNCKQVLQVMALIDSPEESVCLLWLTKNTCKYLYKDWFWNTEMGRSWQFLICSLFFLLSCFYPHLVHMEKTKGDVHQASNEYKSPIIQLQGTFIRNTIISGFPQSWKVIELQLVLEKSLNVR